MHTEKNTNKLSSYQKRANGYFMGTKTRRTNGNFRPKKITVEIPRFKGHNTKLAISLEI